MRTAKVRRDVMGWLTDDSDVSNLLGSDGDIVPVSAAREDDSNPQLAVGVSLESTSRNNTAEAETYTVRIATSGTFEWVKTGSARLDTLEQLRDEVVTVLTTQRADWLDPSVEADDEILPDASVNRYLGATQFSAGRTDRHPYDE